MRIHSLQWIILCSLLVACKSQQSWHLAEINPDTYRFDRYVGVDDDAAINALIAPYKAELDQEMNKVVAVLDHELTKQRPESTLGNFLADIMQIQAEKYTNRRVDFAVQNYGGIRVPSVAPGNITKGTVFEIMPFDNSLLVLESTGDIVQKLCNKIASSGGWPSSEGLRFVIDGDKATNISITGEALDPNKSYTYALPDYIANGGDGSDFLMTEKRIDTEKLIREVMIDYLMELSASGETIHQEITGRITYKD